MSSGGWLSRLRGGLSRSSSKLTGDIGGIFTGRKVDAATLDELEDALIMADLGVTTAASLRDAIAGRRFDADAGADEVRRALAEHIAEMLEPVARPISDMVADGGLRVILVAGVNGTGKTTTIGKLAARFREEGKSVMLAAADTFRAAAIDQLKLWGERAEVPVVAGEPGGDPAAIAFDAMERARNEQADVLLIDTAGRLHNKADLMDELKKIVRVIGRVEPDAPHDVLLVLDATTGQNAHAQVETFRELVDVTGLVVTKLDGSARGGVIVGLADKFSLPIYAVGVGEGIDDLRPFEARAFAEGLMGLDDDAPQDANA
ncbi:MAG: signal recognition particle-docking protein FtsY [Alphaproteobacteria bacterium]|nr:signal recognition particle-docking protein FtsY [Alphaproteobacteria bacterium]